MVQKVKFVNTDKSDFSKILRERVNLYFSENNISPYANAEMIVKSIVMFSGLFLSYGLLISGTLPGWAMLVCCVTYGIFMSGIGFSVQHDANHGAYSHRHWINELMGYSLNLVGGNAFTWKIQHNILHHTYTNVYGMDEDLDAGIVVRLSPKATHRPHHRYQHYFAFFLYGLVTLSWVLAKDFKKIKRYNGGSDSAYQQKHPLKEYIILYGTKLLHIFYAVFLPLYLLDITFLQWLGGYLLMHFVSGLILSLVFQTAHVVEGLDFPEPNEEGNIENLWAIHQICTTANFARKNRLINFYVGGLNYQIEHHLFSKICHVHYPKISIIVQKTVEEYGLPYHEFPTFWSAIVSHYEMLKRLSKEQEIEESVLEEVVLVQS